MSDQETQKPPPMASRTIAEDRYPALMAVLKARGDDAASVGLYKTDGGFEVRYPERLENAVTTALADNAALDAVALEKRRALMLRQLSMKHAEHIAAGYTTNMPDGGQATFQIRPDDVPNWLVAKSLYSDAIAANQGDVEGAHLRDAADIIHIVTFTEAHQILAAMNIYGAAVMRVNWAKKDAINLATDFPDLDAIDLNSGWPVTAILEN